MISLQNRRYIGNKHKLLQNIENIVRSNFADNKITFADLFAGTGVVGYHFAKKQHNVIINDILYSNYVPFKAWFNDEKFNKEKVENILEKFNQLKFENITPNYFSNIYADKYFSLNNAKAIGFIREEIEIQKSNLTDREYYILLSSLMYYTDKIANTVGHFEHYLKKKPIDKPLKLEMLNLQSISNAQIFDKDANELAKQIECDVAYLDPPYNARQYVNFYHVLENLVKWDKPTTFEGTSMKFPRNHLKSGYSKSKAPDLFRDLIENLSCKLIIVSYNNTYTASSVASNNKIKEQELIDILSSKGKIEIMEIDYKGFNTGKTNFKNHKEKLYICEVY